MLSVPRSSFLRGVYGLRVSPHAARLLLAFIPLTTPLIGQPHPAAMRDTIQLAGSADELQRAGRWRDAAAVLQRLTQLRPDNATDWTRLGLVWAQAGEHVSSAAALQRAFTLRPQPGIAYRLAVSYAHQNLKTRTAAYLDTAMALGFGNVDLYAAEAAFQPWRDDPAFRDMPARLRAVSRPCESRVESRQLDYWVGTWEQRSSAGAVVGETEYRAALSGCALVEHTTNPPLYSAVAFHYFNTERGAWVQHYLDSAGKDLWYTGDVRGDTLVYRLSSAPVGGRTIYRSIMVRESADRIRWRFETSDDDGRSWRTAFDGFYVRKSG
jgi:tetratricopeptide (TPR) repeat protein